MLIVLEGVDGAGKSTLAERLLTHLGEEHLRFHCGPLKGDPLKEYEWRLRDYVPNAGQHIVADRWHVGELVYGPLYRGTSRLTDPMRKHVEMYLDKLGAHKLVVTASIWTIFERLRSRGEDFLQEGHVGLVWDFYNEYANQHGWQLVGSDEILSFITRAARRKELDAARLKSFRSYVGGPHPRYLILGTSAMAGSDFGRPRYASAFVPYADTIGHTVIGSLEAARLRDYGMAYADVEDVGDLWRVLGRPYVMCIGPDAERLARAVPHQTIHEPTRAVDFKAYGLTVKDMLRD